MSKSVYDLIRKPILTEKSNSLGEQGKYVFEVLFNAKKSMIKKAIEYIFPVKVKTVNIINQVGKKKKFKGVMGQRSDVKKAIVTLNKGYTIDLAGGVK